MKSENQFKNAHWDKIVYKIPLMYGGVGWEMSGQKHSGYNIARTVVDNELCVVKYLPSIPLNCEEIVLYGYTMRAIYVEKVQLKIEVFKNNHKIAYRSKNITNSVSVYYKPILAQFRIPKDADSIVLSMLISGTHKGVSFFAPALYVLP